MQHALRHRLLGRLLSGFNSIAGPRCSRSSDWTVSMWRSDATCVLQSPFEAAIGAAMPPDGLITSPRVHSRCLHISSHCPIEE